MERVSARAEIRDTTSRLERSIHAWLTAGGPRRVKAVFHERGAIDAFARRAEQMNVPGLKLLRFDSPQAQIAWLLIEEPSSEIAAQLAHLHRFVASLGAKMYFIATGT